MKYASIDVETTGLEPDWCQVLEIAVVVDDLERPKDPNPPTFHAYITHPRIQGQPYALALNAKILKILSDDKDPDILTPTQALEKIREFLYRHFGTSKITAAGKNFQSFDKPFLASLWPQVKMNSVFHHRSIDPALAFSRKGDEHLPGLELCLKRANVTIPFEIHTAVDDAKAVIELVRATPGWWSS